jgi:predicted metal-dependent hydrolase
VQLPLPLVPDQPDEPALLFVRHRRARRYILRVLDDGTLRVTLPRWGSKREALGFVEASRSWIEAQHARRRSAPPRASRADAAVRARARRELPQQLLDLAARHGIPVTGISVRNQRSRWGSCSRQGRITLNWRLLLVPDFVREYVMLHELMHRRELNHSPRFWRLVGTVCPRVVEARRWLRIEGAALFAPGV